MAKRQRPTVAELRERVYKPQPREIGNRLAIHWGRPAAIYGTWLAIRLGLSAHQITLGATLATMAGAIALGTGDRWGFVAGAAFLHLAFWLDHVDGQVARWRESTSLDGVYFDYLMHHLWALVVGFACGFGLAVRTGELIWTFAGFLVAAGWLGLGLHNDCKYKAFFERLISDSHRYRLTPKQDIAPHALADRRRSGLSRWMWPAYKCCEPHLVLLAMTGWSAFAIAQPAVWLAGWMIAVAGMAALAPILAIARAVHAIRRDSVEREFRAWFQIDPDEARSSSQSRE